MADELFIKDLPESLRGVERRFPRLITTLALGEEGDQPTTMALGEEGDQPVEATAQSERGARSPKVFGLGWVVTTMMVGEEGGDITTMALGEEGGGEPVPAIVHGTIVTTLAVGEEGGDATTMAVGEEGGDYR